MPPAIPDRWTAYKACGKVIDGTRIICFKVPLSKHVQRNVKGVKEIWDIKTLLKTIPKLAGVIDLTNTTRYYSPHDIMNMGISHKKIFMPGRMIPPPHKVTEFMDTVDEFLKKDDESLVGVHCTHGLNRTGYMVCRYMRDRLGFSAKDAIKDFQKARGYIMEREVYITDLLGTTPAFFDIPENPTAYRPTEDEKDTKDKSLDSNDKRRRLTNDKDTNYREEIRLHKKYDSSDESDEKKRKRKNATRKRNDSNRSSQDYDFKYDY